MGPKERRPSTRSRVLWVWYVCGKAGGTGTGWAVTQKTAPRLLLRGDGWVESISETVLTPPIVTCRTPQSRNDPALHNVVEH